MSFFKMTKLSKFLPLLVPLCLVVLLATMSNCSDNPPTIKSLARTFIEKECKDSLNCIVSIPMLTPFEWDKMYVFEYNAIDEEINQVIRQKFRRHIELTKVWVFMQGDSIVHFEEHEIDFERPTKRDLIFQKGSEKFVEFTPSSAIFNVSTKWWKEDGYTYYILSSILYDKIEQIKAKDTTVTYAELLDDGYHALLYRPIYPDVLFFVRLSDSVLYEVDSIVDFNHDFVVYRTEAELIKEMGNFTAKDINKKDFKKLADYELNRKNYLRNHFHKPTMGRFAGDLFMLDDGGVYKLSLSKRLFDKVIYYSIALNIPDSCDDNILSKPYPNPQKNISSSVIKVSFDDGSFFELTPNGSLNIQVVDRNTCLIIESDFNNEHVKYKEGKKCDKAFMICE